MVNTVDILWLWFFYSVNIFLQSYEADSVGKQPAERVPGYWVLAGFLPSPWPDAYISALHKCLRQSPPYRLLEIALRLRIVLPFKLKIRRLLFYIV